jgi:hypothetical protein
LRVGGKSIVIEVDDREVFRICRGGGTADGNDVVTGTGRISGKLSANNGIEEKILAAAPSVGAVVGCLAFVPSAIALGALKNGFVKRERTFDVVNCHKATWLSLLQLNPHRLLRVRWSLLPSNIDVDSCGKTISSMWGNYP